MKYKFPEAQMHSINYGQQFAWDKVNTKEDIVIMVDFSLQPFSEMAKLHTEFDDRLIWIDHHISAIEESKSWKDGDNKSLNDKINGLRMVGLAGCELTWKHFFPEIEMPNAVRLLGRYDVWDHKDPNVLPFQMGIRLENTWPDAKNMSMWQDYFSKFSEELIKDTVKEGKTILRYQKQENEKYAKSCAMEIDFHGYKAIAINKLLTNSQLFDSVWDESKYDLMITFGLRVNGMWTMSFYTTKENVDCSQIAKSFGGGGHKQASGCNFKTLPPEFIKQIKLKQPVKFGKIPEYGDKMTLKEFIEDVDCGMFIDYDGHGYYATENEMTDIAVLPSMIINKNID
ncbi:MAG TPA: hypothetical protein PKG96_09160, partial [Bacilli bacterium]|nr:hypothetical protein [Bacilli bacterium]